MTTRWAALGVSPKKAMGLEENMKKPVFKVSTMLFYVTQCMPGLYTKQNVDEPLLN